MEDQVLNETTVTVQGWIGGPVSLRPGDLVELSDELMMAILVYQCNAMVQVGMK